jgi:hypothetical protein
MAKKKQSAQASCDQHPPDEVVAYGVNLDICQRCGSHIHKNYTESYDLSDRITLNPGDLIKIKGVRGVHRYDGALLDQPEYSDRDLPSGDYVKYTMLDAGRPWKQGCTAHVDRVRRASRRTEVRD